MQTLRVKRLRETAQLPTRGTTGSAGYDLYACIDEPVTINPGQIEKLPTGIAIELQPGFAGFVFARSSLGIKYAVVPANCVGVIDSDYRGEVLVGLMNHAEQPYTVQPGERIAQLVILAVTTPELIDCDSLSDTERGSGGFGSTGKM